ncbi:MAG: squalene/phytoene synthase family protein [Alphaproteobacteria bacterium]|jgi:phytoene synthase|nr:squalene/phytoene synthase family protein [Alphaproteobacteria bacterium]
MTLAPALGETAPSARAVLKTHGRSFHFASKFLGERHGANAARLYAFCRHVDDTADNAESAQAAGFELDRLEAEINGQRPAGPRIGDFLALADETNMDLRAAQALVAGVRSDLGPVAFASERELVRYAYHVAGVVGLMMCAVLDVDDPAAAPFAIDLGIAMQLTNIARDVGEDAAMGRRYLPAEWVGDLVPDRIGDPDTDTAERLRAGTRRLLAKAEAYYESGEAGMAYLPARARLAILVAARVYRRIGVAARHGDHETWRMRAQVAGPVKAAIALGAMGDFAFSSRLHQRGAQHDSHLHAALDGLPSANLPAGGPE